MADKTKHGDKTDRKRVNLALQGGGSHGAFAWGVLDRLLEDERIEIEGLVGTSAGAMNAAVTANGLMEGGNAGARTALRRFWSAVSARGAYSIDAAVMARPVERAGQSRLRPRLDRDGPHLAHALAVSNEPRQLSSTARDPRRAD